VNGLLDWWTEYVDEQSRELIKLNPLKREEAAVRAHRGHIMVERKSRRRSSSTAATTTSGATG
jgi:hypothetical protein